MAIVSDILGRIDSAVVSAGAQLFKNSADSLQNVLIGMCTAFLAVIGIMMVLGISKMTARETVQVVMRIMLVMLFGQTWGNFNAIYSAASDGFGNLALSYFDVAGASGEPSVTAAMETMAENLQKNVDGVMTSVGSITRGVLGAVLYVILGLLMAAYVLIVGFAKIMTAVLLGLAPLAIMATIFDKTKNLFEAWLSALIGYMLYPVGTAGIIGTLIVVTDDTFRQTGGETGLADVLPFLVVVIVGIGALASIPTFVASITGNFSLGTFAPQALTIAGAPLIAGAERAQNYGREFASGFMNDGKTIHHAQRDRSRNAAEAGGKAKEYTSTYYRRIMAHRLTPTDKS